MTGPAAIGEEVANGGSGGGSGATCGASMNEPKIAVKLDPASGAAGEGDLTLGAGGVCADFTASMITVGVSSSLFCGDTSANGGEVVDEC
jgi:hypothetical protein